MLWSEKLNFLCLSIKVEVPVFSLLPKGANPKTLLALCHSDSIVNSLISTGQKGFLQLYQLV